MAEKIRSEISVTDSKLLVVSVCGFLTEQRNNLHLADKAKRKSDGAIKNIEKSYKFSFVDFLKLKDMRPLDDIFAVGQQPIPVKNRIAAQSHKQRGNTFMESKMFNLAAEEYTEAINMDPTNAVYYCNRAASKIGQRIFISAIEDCDKALELDKNYATAHCWLGLAHVLIDNPALAIRHYRHAFKIDPSNPVLVANLDLIRKKLNHPSFRVYDLLFQSSTFLPPIAVSTAKTVPQKTDTGDHVDEKKPNQKKDFEIEKFGVPSSGFPNYHDILNASYS